MKNIKQTYKRLVRYFISLINKILLRNQDKKNNIFLNKFQFKVSNFNKHLISLINNILLRNQDKKKNIFLNKFQFKISNFNKYLIFLISLMFIYLFYLSIPNLYSKDWVQNTFEEKLFDEFKINFSVSSEITYEILPSPHFIIRNAKIIDNTNDMSNEISEIKKLKIYLSQKNLFNKEKLKITSILIDQANFSVQPENIIFFKKLINKKFSNKKINIKNSNIFIKNNINETITIIKISKILLFHEAQKFLNNLNFKGEIFNLFFNLDLNKEIKAGNKSIMNTKLESLKLNISDESYKESKKITKGLNSISILNSKLNTSYNLTENLLIFESKKSKLINSNIYYKGKLSIKPFNFIIKVDMEKIKLTDWFNQNSIFVELLKNKTLLNKNINTQVSINSPKIVNNKLFNSASIKFNVIEGKINFDKTHLTNNKIGVLEITRSNLFFVNNDLIFNGDVNIEVKNSDNLFSFLQTVKKSRIPIKNIFINFDYNLTNNTTTLNKVNFDDRKMNKELEYIISTFNSQANTASKNLIKNKNWLNKLIGAYSG